MSRFGKQLSFALLLALAVAIAIEGIAQVLYFTHYGIVYSPNDLPRHATRPNPDNTPKTITLRIAPQIIHPYFGYASDRPKTMGMSGRELHPLQKRAEGKFVVAVSGGSVANQVRRSLGEAFRSEFERRGLELEPVIVSPMVDGFKQPQQLAAITFFLAIGAEYDVLINIDGFNDIVLPIVDNYERGIYPFYPRLWDSFVNRRPSQVTIMGAGEIAFLRQQQRERVENVTTSAIGRSAILGLYHTSRLRRNAARILQIQQKLLGERIDLPFEATGPYKKYDDIAQVYDEAAAVWARSSILIHHILSGVGTPYFHVLQPNQYVKGSKVLTASELRIAYDTSLPYAKLAARGYPYLVEASREIVDSGVHYYDATQIFKHVAEDVYKDQCCHVNEFGERLFAQSVAEWVAGSVFGD